MAGSTFPFPPPRGKNRKTSPFLAYLGIEAPRVFFPRDVEKWFESSFSFFLTAFWLPVKETWVSFLGGKDYSLGKESWLMASFFPFSFVVLKKKDPHTLFPRGRLEAGSGEFPFFSLVICTETSFLFFPPRWELLSLLSFLTRRGPDPVSSGAWRKRAQRFFFLSPLFWSGGGMERYSSFSLFRTKDVKRNVEKAIPPPFPSRPASTKMGAPLPFLFFRVRPIWR